MARFLHVARVLPVLLALGTASCLFAGPSTTDLPSSSASPSASSGPSGSAPPPSATPVPSYGPTLLPDLGMAPMRRFSIDTTVTGHPRLRFTTVLINIGAGPMVAYGHSPVGNGDLLVDQQIATSGGALMSIPSGFHMYFAGDGHHHWHLRDLETYQLQNSAATLKRISDKHGFCFFDDVGFNLTLPGAPQSPVHQKADCGTAADTSVTMGISVGWSDRYDAKLPDQYIDISDLPAGEYTLTATADAQGYLQERCEGNNSTTAILQITGTTVSVVDRGKASEACAA